MNKLWAPWRMQYIQKIGSEKGCIFCTKPRQSNDRKNLVLYRGKYCFVILNLYPYNNGHMMVVPYRHTPRVSDISGATLAELWDLVGRCIEILRKRFHAEGFNVGINAGKIAGAGIKEHLHVHIVPRWNGDTNYMPVIGGAKVISQALSDAWEQLYPLFHAKAGKGRGA